MLENTAILLFSLLSLSGLAVPAPQQLFVPEHRTVDDGVSLPSSVPQQHQAYYFNKLPQQQLSAGVPASAFYSSQGGSCGLLFCERSCRKACCSHEQILLLFTCEFMAQVHFRFWVFVFLFVLFFYLLYILF